MPGSRRTFGGGGRCVTSATFDVLGEGGGVEVGVGVGVAVGVGVTTTVFTTTRPGSTRCAHPAVAAAVSAAAATTAPTRVHELTTGR